MERWTLVPRRNRGGPQFFIKNRSATQVWLGPRARRFDVDTLFRKLEEVQFPLRYTRGLKRVNFTILSPDYFGEYGDETVWVDTRRKHRLTTLVETFVHEVAHYLDEQYDYSDRLTKERKHKGKRIHRVAGQSDDEYFARGFERFYSIKPGARADLQKHHPVLFKKISSLHKRYASKR